MKKFCIILTCLTMALSFAACGGKKTDTPETTSEAESVVIDNEGQDVSENITDEQEARKLPSKNPKELKMTDYIGVRAKDVIEVFGDKYTLEMSGYEGADAFIYYAEGSYLVSIGLRTNGETDAEKIKENATVMFMATRMNSEEMDVNGEHTTKITYAETQKFTSEKPTLYEGDGSITSSYKDKNGYAISFFWETLTPAADDVPASVMVFEKTE